MRNRRIVVSVLVGILFNTLQISLQLDSSDFLIYNKDHQTCVAIVSPDLIQASDCDPSTDSQRFRWISGDRILSISHKLCFGVNGLEDWSRADLVPCDELSPVQKWECRSENRFAIKNRQLHLNYHDEEDFPNIRLNAGTGSGSHWVIYGAENDLCSHGYQEIFTIDGNALGAPCEFPFKYRGHWYAECISDWKHLGMRLWCATVTDYDQYGNWGFCPTKSTTGWDLDPVTGVYYQRNTESALTWYQARKSCQQQDANLLSITELHEQSYISALPDASGSSLWIGLNSLDLKSGWQWSNGNPFRYLNWAPGHPLPNDGMDCAALNPGKASEWESLACSSKLGYICRKDSTTITPSVEKDEPSFCPVNWEPYSGHCYSLSRTKRTWDDALSACLAEGASLTSIHNLEEHSFIISQTGYLPTDELWIGLNDQKTQNLFEWSDRSNVTFAKWDVGEPSHTAILREHCVVMKGKEGKWADQACEKEYGYMCKKEASTEPDGSLELISPGCPAGWIRFSSYCYSIAVEAKTFNEAETACGQSAANLVQVADMYENAFLISQFGFRPEKYLWIGLSSTEHVGTFEWTNKQTVTFTQFNVGMPERHQGCVAMLTGTSAGLWDVISCASKEKYICKKLAEGVTTTEEPPVTQPFSCPSEWIKKDPGNCIRVYINSNEDKKTWTEARNYCKDIGGDLASFHDESETNNLPDIDIDEWTPAWIGYNLLDDHAGFVWSDGTSSNYENWDYGEPNNIHSREHCVEVYLSYNNKWNDVDCEIYLDWICQIRLGTTPKPPPTDTPQAEVTVTDDGWIQFSGSQYYINNEHLDMEDARTACKKNHSDLVVINSQSERLFLYKQLSRGFYDMYYIGLTVSLDESISWVDGSPVVYTAWDYNEPSFYIRDENCVVMYSWTGSWKNINCGVWLPSICERSANFVSTTAAPTTVPEGGCSSDWTAFQGKCYKFSRKDGSQDKSWHDARQYCISQGGNLVSILSQAEQAFLTTMILGGSEDVWIGLNGVTSETLFLWTDGTRVSYTNWAKGNQVSVPDGRRAHGVELECVVMVKGPDLIAGMWKVEHCGEKRGFVCKRNTGEWKYCSHSTNYYNNSELLKIDPLVEVPVTTVAPVAPASSFKPGNDLFKVQAEKMSWDEARRQCKADDADLASVLDSVTLGFITLWTVHLKEPIWIGLNSDVTGGQYRWIDNCFLNYTEWAVGEPQRDQACVYIDTDGTWKTSDCNKSYYSVCKHSPKPQVKEGSHGYAGIVVAVVLVIIAAAGLAGFLFYNRPFFSMTWEHAFNNNIELRNIAETDI